MKRKLYVLPILAILTFSLAACSNSNSSSDAQDSPKVEKKKSTATDVKSVSGTKSIKIVGEKAEQGHIIEAITYKDDEYKTIKETYYQPMPNDVKQKAKSLDFNEVRGAIVPELEKEKFIKDMKKVKGLTVKVDVTKNYETKIEMTFDMKNLDRDAAEKADTPVNWEAIDRYTPLEYILVMERGGARPVDQ